VETSQPVDVYDVEKLVSYPGFNVDLPEGVRDDYHRQGMPPMQPNQRKEVLAAFLTKAAPGSGLKRGRRMSSRDGPSKKRARHDTDDNQDMDLGESEGLEEPHSVPSSIPSSQEGSPKRSETPTLSDLEEKQRLLQQQLASNISDVTESCDSDTDTEKLGASGLEFKVPGPTSAPGTPATNMPAPSYFSTPADKLEQPSFTEDSVLSTPNSSSNLSRSLSMSLGTPVPKNNQALPDPSKFQQNVEDHIPFENLPDAIGSYEKLRKLLKKT